MPYFHTKAGTPRTIVTEFTAEDALYWGGGDYEAGVRAYHEWCEAMHASHPHQHSKPAPLDEFMAHMLAKRK